MDYPDLIRLAEALLATPLAFRAWLKNRTGEYQTYSVGYSVCSRACPIANFLSETTGAGWSVEPGLIKPAGSKLLSFRPPMWVTEFTREVDRRGEWLKDSGGRRSVPISRRVAVRTLNRIVIG